MNETKNLPSDNLPSDNQINELAQKYDINRLCGLFLSLTTPEELRADLLEAYFMAVEPVLDECLEPCSPRRMALYTLRSLIYATAKPQPEGC